jgi:DhnA family fructose-bisphosphate aldolase class Ia
MEWGMPLLAMMYTRGPKVKSEYDVKMVKHAGRLGAELGADMIKVPYTGSPESFHEVVEGCSVPVVIAGGEKIETDKDILEMVKGAIVAGGAGVSIGRNVFQHKDPSAMAKAISSIIHKGATIEEGDKLRPDKPSGTGDKYFHNRPPHTQSKARTNAHTLVSADYPRDNRQCDLSIVL